MGIDIYLKWDGFTEEDNQAQLKGFDTTIGNTGYLREAYHSDIYATHYLVEEAFKVEFNEEEYEKLSEKEQREFGYVSIQAEKLVKRLPETIRIVIQRQKDTYQADLDQALPVVKSFIDFVALAVKLEREGKNPKIYASY